MGGAAAFARAMRFAAMLVAFAAMLAALALALMLAAMVGVLIVRDKNERGS